MNNIEQSTVPPLSRASLRRSKRSNAGSGIQINDSRTSLRSHQGNDGFSQASSQHHDNQHYYDNDNDLDSASTYNSSPFRREGSQRSSTRFRDSRTSRRSRRGGGDDSISVQDNRSSIREPTPLLNESARRISIERPQPQPIPISNTSYVPEERTQVSYGIPNPVNGNQSDVDSAPAFQRTISITRPTTNPYQQNGGGIQIQRDATGGGYDNNNLRMSTPSYDYNQADPSYRTVDVPHNTWQSSEALNMNRAYPVATPSMTPIASALPTFATDQNAGPTYSSIPYADPSPAAAQRPTQAEYNDMSSSGDYPALVPAPQPSKAPPLKSIPTSEIISFERPPSRKELHGSRNSGLNVVDRRGSGSLNDLRNSGGSHRSLNQRPSSNYQTHTNAEDSGLGWNNRTSFRNLSPAGSNSSLNQPAFNPNKYAGSDMSGGDDLKYENHGLRAMLNDANEMISQLRKKNIDMEKEVKASSSNTEELAKTLVRLRNRLLEDGFHKYLEIK